PMAPRVAMTTSAPNVRLACALATSPGYSGGTRPVHGSRARSEETRLLRASGYPERGRVERPAVPVEAEAPAGEVEEVPDPLRMLARALHAAAEDAVGHSAAVSFPHTVEHLVLPQRVVRLQPLLEHLRHGAGQPEQRVAGALSASCGHGSEDVG